MLALDLFAGVGGMSLGFKRAGFSVVGAFEHDDKHVATYARNFPETKVFSRDVRSLTSALIQDLCDISEPLDVIFGGPPCQGFSIIGKREAKDERNTLLAEFSRIVRELMPRVFVLENVAGILSRQYVPLLQDFYSTMTRAGYTLISEPLLLNARDFGIPQARRRVFIIGVLPPLNLPVLPFSCDLCVRPTVKDAIGDLPLIEDLDYLLNDDVYVGEIGTPSSYAESLRINKDGSARYSQSLSGFLRTRHTDVVRERFHSTKPGNAEPVSRFYRLSYSGIAPTLRAGSSAAYGKFMAARPIHPVEDRCITVREAARLHSFPDWFEFHPTKWYGYMQVGNSVPPLLAEMVARSIISRM